MSITVLGSPRSLAHQASGSVSIAFPSVCFTPESPSALVPIPYPNLATRARAVQQKMAIGRKQPVVVSGTAGAMRPATALTVHAGPNRSKAATSRALEVQQIKGELNRLNMKLQLLMTSDPNQWQGTLQAYAVAAGALYVTLTDDDDD
jgi:hypothetical protein